MGYQWLFNKYARDCIQYNGVLTIKRNLNFFCKKYARSLYRTQYNNANQIVNNYLKKHKDTGENTILFFYISLVLLFCYIMFCVKMPILCIVQCSLIFKKKIMSFKKDLLIIYLK